MNEILTINLLIVEDDKAQIEMYSDAIKLYNENYEGRIIIKEVIKETLNDAFQELRSTSFDVAFVDLRLGDTSMELAGNNIAEEVLKNIRIPLYIISGHIGDVDNKFDKYKNTFFRPINKGDIAITELLEEISKIVRTGITKILNREGIVEKFINKIFRNHLHHSMNYWIDKSNNENTHDALLRYVMSHLQEFLEVSESGFLEDYHIPEFYIVSPIKKSNDTVFTGDIVKEIDTEDKYFIITPICDLATGKNTDGTIRKPKAENVTLLKIDQLMNPVKPDTKSNKIFSSHYLPPLNNIFEGGVINFQKIKSVALTDLIDENQYGKLFSITSAFKKDIISRFSNYYSRQGQPVIKPH